MKTLADGIADRYTALSELALDAVAVGKRGSKSFNRVHRAASSFVRISFSQFNAIWMSSGVPGTGRSIRNLPSCAMS